MRRKKDMPGVLRPLKNWMRFATTTEQSELAKQARTSREYLYQLGNGVRAASPEIAGRIEAAAKKLRRLSKGRLPILTRADLSPVCGGCPYAMKCTGEKKHGGKRKKNVGKKKNP